MPGLGTDEENKGQNDKPLDKKKIGERFDNFMKFLEKDRLNVVWVFIYLIIVSLVRMILEVELFGYSYNIYLYIHAMSFFYVMFLIGLSVITYFSREKVRKVTNLLIWGFWIIILPPLIDFFIFNNPRGYFYLRGNPFFAFFELKGTASMGQWIQFLFILIIPAIYIFYKTRSYLRTILGGLILYIVCLLVSTPALNPLFYEYTPFIQQVFILYYLLLSIILCLIIMRIARKGLVMELMKNLRFKDALILILLAFIGVVLADAIALRNILSWPLGGEFVYLMLTVVVIIFGWQFAIILNVIFDSNIDIVTNPKEPFLRKIVTRNELKGFAILCGIISITFSVLIGFYLIVLAIFCIILAIVYSVPPIRLRNTLFSSTIIGLGSAFAFLMGYFTPSASFWNPAQGWEPELFIQEFTSEVIIFSVIIFLIFTIRPLIRDLRNYKNDKKEGAKTLYTVYGIKNGLKVTSLLLFSSYLMPLLLFHQFIDFVIILPLTIYGAMSFWRFKDTPPVILSYVIIISYTVIRWRGYLVL